jgi:hypothetical protein
MKDMVNVSNKNKCLSIQTNIFKWKSSTKGGKSTSINGWKWWRVAMVSVNGVARKLGANACNIQTYSFTWTRACVRHIRVDVSGVRFVVISKDLWETYAYALFVCSSCNVSLVPYHVLMQMNTSLLVAFLTTLWWKRQTLRIEEQKCMPNCYVEWINDELN